MKANSIFFHSFPVLLTAVFVVSMPFYPETFVDGFHDADAVRGMQYNILGKTMLNVSKLSIGGSTFGNVYGTLSEEDGADILRIALQKGINYIDTGPHYGLGRSEKSLGKALKSIPRNAFYISTKVCRYETFFDFSATTVKKSLKKSLDLLGLDCIDIVFIHDIEFAPDLKFLLSETIPALLELKRENKLRFIGASAYPVSVLKDLCELSNDIDVVLTYSRDTLFDNTLETFTPFFRSKNIGVINAACTGMSLLTSAGPCEWHPASPRLKELCKKAAEEAKSNCVELGRLATYYTVQKPYSSCLVGIFSLSILLDNLDVTLNGISNKEKQILTDIIGRYFPEKNHQWEESNLKSYSFGKSSDKYKYEEYLSR